MALLSRTLTGFRRPVAAAEADSDLTDATMPAIDEVAAANDETIEQDGPALLVQADSEPPDRESLRDAKPPPAGAESQSRAVIQRAMSLRLLSSALREINRLVRAELVAEQTFEPGPAVTDAADQEGQSPAPSDDAKGIEVPPKQESDATTQE